MDTKSEIEFLILLKVKVTFVASQTAIIGPLQEVIVMIEERIEALRKEKDER